MNTDSREEFLWAIRTGNKTIASQSISRYSKEWKNASNEDGCTLLHLAAENGQIEIAEYLISMGADREAKNKWGRTPFLEAVFNGQEDAMNLLIINGCNIHAKADTETGALGLASGKGHLSIAKKLIEMGFDVNETDSDGFTGLHWASFGGGHVKVAEYLISIGANLEAKNKWGRTPFLQAVLDGQKGVMNLLIKIGCNIHAKADTKTRALGLASQKGHVSIAKKLIEMGFDVNKTDSNGMTGLHWASWGGHVKVAEYLISIEANLEAKNKWGRTPFLEAVFAGQVGVMNSFIKNGCNIYAKDNNKEGALFIADQRNHLIIKKKIFTIMAKAKERDEFISRESQNECLFEELNECSLEELESLENELFPERSRALVLHFSVWFFQN